MPQASPLLVMRGLIGQVMTQIKKRGLMKTLLKSSKVCRLSQDRVFGYMGRQVNSPFVSLLLNSKSIYVRGIGSRA